MYCDISRDVHGNLYVESDEIIGGYYMINVMFHLMRPDIVRGSPRANMD